MYEPSRAAYHVPVVQGSLWIGTTWAVNSDTRNSNGVFTLSFREVPVPDTLALKFSYQIILVVYTHIWRYILYISRNNQYYLGGLDKHPSVSRTETADKPKIFMHDSDELQGECSGG
jgi:hypothetical protein